MKSNFKTLSLNLISLKVIVLYLLFFVQSISIGQNDSISNSLSLDDFFTETEEAPSLLPEKMLITQRVLWGNRGLMRNYSYFDLTAEYRQRELNIRRYMLSANQILGELKLPVFVKPNNGGSSFGISKVNIASELAPALEKAFKEDNQVLVEEYISGREFTVGVFKSKGVTTVLPITEIKTENEFFDFAAKYEGKSEEITPAEITASMFKDLTEAATKVYTIFNCSGVVRIDFIYNEEVQKAYLLEVNTVPGQSEASIIPQQVKAMGWSLTDFYGTIIEDILASK